MFAVTGHSFQNGLSFWRRDCRFGGAAVARSAGSEGRLWGGSDPQTNYAWCASSQLHSSGNVVPIAFGGDCVSEPTVVSEEERRWHNRRAATSGWSMAPDPVYLSQLGTLAIPNSNLRGATRKLHLVTLEL